ncbi:MAG: glutamate--cysteine ligase [Fusobacteriota bacterium]
MTWNIKNIFKKLKNNKKLLLEGNWGLEVEYLRVKKDGTLAMTSHPEKFGDKLKNNNITVDYSESQLELITNPHKSIDKTFLELQNIYNKTIDGLDNEYLWPLSMPASLPPENKIPLAKYDNSKKGKENEIYRRGLGLRYSKTMQMISGVHYNFSLSDDLISKLYHNFKNNNSLIDFKNKLYENLTRNFLENRWLLIYLFGASPNYHDSYSRSIEKQIDDVKKKCSKCKQCNYEDNHLDYATSIRVSRFGYSSTIQDKLNISFNSLDDYITDCNWATTTSYEKYTKFGLFQNGKQIQLNDYYLQRPSEYYSPIRYKQHTLEGESTLDALQNRGIEYLETRLIDKNPFIKEGVTKNQLYFIHLFLLSCMMTKSKKFDKKDMNTINTNHHLVSLLGRKPHLNLIDNNNDLIPLIKLGENLFKNLEIISNFLGDKRYQNAVKKEKMKLYDKSLLPSHKLEKNVNNSGDFLNTGMRLAKNQTGEENL